MLTQQVLVQCQCARVDEQDDLSYLTWDSVEFSLDAGLKNGKMLAWDNFGTGDFRSPSFCVKYSDGYTVSPVEYVFHEIFTGKPIIDRNHTENDREAATLRATLKDPLTSLRVNLYYTIYRGTNGPTRRAVIENRSSQRVSLLAANSFTVDFPNRKDYHLSSLTGS